MIIAYKEEGYVPSIKGSIPRHWIIPVAECTEGCFSCFYYDSEGVNGWQEVQKDYFQGLQRIAGVDRAVCIDLYSQIAA
jgi:hypothetical protein